MDSWVQIGIAFLALLVATAGLTFNGLQFKQWNKELKARAILSVGLSVRGATRGVLLVPCDTHVADCLVRVAITNVGDRAATAILINFLAPTFIDSMEWVSPTGEPVGGGEAAPALDDEVLIEPGQPTTYESEYLDFEADRIGRRAVFEVHVLMRVRIPSSNEIRVPVRATAAADEIPDDVAEYEDNFLIVLKRHPNHPSPSS